MGGVGAGSVPVFGVMLLLCRECFHRETLEKSLIEMLIAL